jgi:hypothetical protein
VISADRHAGEKTSAHPDWPDTLGGDRTKLTGLRWFASERSSDE